MPDQPYKRPPITEAVIEVRFSAESDPTDPGKVSASFATHYPVQQMVRNVAFAVGLPAGPDGQLTAEIKNQQVGHRRASTDLTELVVILPASFAVAQLAPYPGWGNFFDRFVQDWKIWKSKQGYKKINRLGVRFTNRIDVPIVGERFEMSDYLKVYPEVPEILGPMTGYGVQVQVAIPDIGCNLVINSAAVQSPLLGHSSFLLDLDITSDAPPQHDDAIYELLNRVRAKKNEVFEACVTDKTRELFQK